MNASHPSTSENDAVRRLARLEARVAQLEARAGLPADTEPTATSRAVAEPPSSVPSGDDLEEKVGQDWFARIGIGVLALGAGITLSLPFAGLPAFAPSLAGYGLAAGLYVLAQRWRPVRDLAAYLREQGQADREILGAGRADPDPMPYLIPVGSGTAQERIAAVSRFAEHHGVTAHWDAARYTWRAVLWFGPVRYVAFCIPGDAAELPVPAGEREPELAVAS